jgi:hypothetical protein
MVEFQVKKFLNMKVICWALFIFFLLLTVFIRFRLLNIPLERDEGEYAYFGQLILQGIAPFKLAYDFKMPGLYLAYALCMAVFGQSIQGIHLGLLAVNLASIILLFFITKRLFGYIAGIFSSVTYAILSMSQSVFGAHSHATHFVVLMALFGILFLLKAVDTGKRKFAFWSGLFFGLSFLMKQPGIFFVFFGIFYLSWDYFKKNKGLKPGLTLPLFIFTIGAALPLVLTCAVLFFAGVFYKFWFWTFNYAFNNLFRISFDEALKLLMEQLMDVANPFQALWYMAILGVACVFIDNSARKSIVFVISLFIASLLSICPGSKFHPHYFVTVLPIISILVGCCINTSVGFIQAKSKTVVFDFMPVIIFICFILFALYQQKNYFFKLTPFQISRQTYGDNPFIESIAIADYIKANSYPFETIAVLGSEPELYFYSQRHSATGYVNTYDIMTNQPYAFQMQQEMIREIEYAQPRYLIFVNVQSSWVVLPNSEKLIFKWADAYIQKHYKIVGIVDLVSGDRTDYYWDAGAQNVIPHSPSYVKVFKRQS